jgi:phosphatidylserine/phosphatidylglycerophosphate/cardiolipin synthase-like enzyme
MTLYNREWHAVVESPALADTFQRYLRGDFETASNAPEAALEAAVVAGPDLLLPVDELLEAERAAVDLQVFRPERFVFSEQDPLTVQPILTPDNYLDIVLDLLRKRPAKKLYFQNQSLNPVLSPTPRWAELLRLLAEYSNDDSLDVRIIFRNIGPIRKKLESLQAAGFNMERVRSQSGCHTKGIVIDSATVLLGSHNWTNQGVEANRDATLLIKNAQIATYYERVFVHDWERIAKPTIREEATPVPLLGGMETASVEAAGAAAALLVPWSAWLEE